MERLYGSSSSMFELVTNDTSPLERRQALSALAAAETEREILYLETKCFVKYLFVNAPFR